MGKIRSINGRPIAKHILHSLIIILAFVGAGLWALDKFFSDERAYNNSFYRMDSIFVFYIFHYAFLICSAVMLIFSFYFLTLVPRQVFGVENKPWSKRIDKVFVPVLLYGTIMIVPITIAGHFYAKYQFGQAGYTECNTFLLSNRYKRAFVLDADDCYDGKLRWILAQRNKNSAARLQEAHVYLRDKHHLTIKGKSDG